MIRWRSKALVGFFMLGCSAEEHHRPTFDRQKMRLEPCPASPNCVSSMASPQDQEHYIRPLAMTKLSSQMAQQRLLVVLKQAQANLDMQQSDYWRMTFQTPWLRFTDDVEFYFSAKERLIHMRSASRVGHSDLGTNRKRLETIRQAFMGINPP